MFAPDVEEECELVRQDWRSRMWTPLPSSSGRASHRRDDAPRPTSPQTHSHYLRWRHSPHQTLSLLQMEGNLFRKSMIGCDCTQFINRRLLKCWESGAVAQSTKHCQYIGVPTVCQSVDNYQLTISDFAFLPLVPGTNICFGQGWVFTKDDFDSQTGFLQISVK